jgi:hypothetical protein
VRETNVRSVVDGQFHWDRINVGHWHFRVTSGNADQTKRQVQTGSDGKRVQRAPSFLGPHGNPFCMTGGRAFAEESVVVHGESANHAKNAAHGHLRSGEIGLDGMEGQIVDNPLESVDFWS